MKKTNYIYQIIPAWGVVFCMIFGASCKKTTNDAPPTITEVRTVSKSFVDSSLQTVNITYTSTLDTSSGKIIYNVDTVIFPNTTPQVIPFDSTVTSGILQTQYAIMGNNLGSVTKILFNGVSAYFNPTLATNSSIIVSIPDNAPWEGTQTNTLVVTTLHGTVSYPFSIQQPPPIIGSFSPLAGSTGDTITIQGSVFNNVSAVSFGIGAGSVPAPIISSTATQIKITVPAGVGSANIYVTTPGGTTKSQAKYGFKYIVFDDALAAGWWHGGWGGGDQLVLDNTNNVESGTSSVLVPYSGGYGGFQVGNGGATISVSTLGLTGIKLSIYLPASGSASQKVVIGINDQEATFGVQVVLIPGQWVHVNIPLNQLGNPTTIDDVIVQEFSGNVVTIYLDNIGFI
jgi:hypothetical protein